MIGKSIGHYRILEEIGSGRNGRGLPRPRRGHAAQVALKLLPPARSMTRGQAAALVAEAAARSRLNHPAVAVVHEYISQPDYDCIVMEYVKGNPWMRSSAGVRWTSVKSCGWVSSWPQRSRGVA